MAQKEWDINNKISNLIICNNLLDRRIKEANIQDNAALVIAFLGPRGTGKSFYNFYLAKKILQSRSKNINWKKRIVFTIDGEMIDTPSKWNEAMKHIANSMNTANDGAYWALLQDELDHEWGEGQKKQLQARKDAIHNLRKLGIITMFADSRRDEKNLNMGQDITLFPIGYNKRTRMMAALMFYDRCQGIILHRMPKEVLDFIKTKYEKEAVHQVWQKAKNGFYQTAINPDGEETDDTDYLKEYEKYRKKDVKKPLEQHFRIAQVGVMNWWKDYFGKRTPALFISSFLVWKKEVNGMTAENADHDDMDISLIARWWFNSKGKKATPGMFYTAKSK